MSDKMKIPVHRPYTRVSTFIYLSSRENQGPSISHGWRIGRGKGKSKREPQLGKVAMKVVFPGWQGVFTIDGLWY